MNIRCCLSWTLLVCPCLFLVSCKPDTLNVTPEQSLRKYRTVGKIFGKGLTFSSGSGDVLETNPYLWRGSLESLCHFPLHIADEKSGLIVTEWASFPEEPNKRFQIRILVCAAPLSCDSFQVNITTQKNVKGDWRVVPSSQALVIRLRESILKTARSLYQKK